VGVCRLGKLSEEELEEYVRNIPEEEIYKTEKITACRDPEAWHFRCTLCPLNCIIHVCESDDNVELKDKITIELVCPKSSTYLVSCEPDNFYPENFDPEKTPCECCDFCIFSSEDDP